MSVRSLVLRLAPALCVVLGVLASVAGPAFALNPERHYEMVSPPFKDGYGASRIAAVAPNGESVAYFSPGVFSEAPTGLSESLDRMSYVARRGTSGWSTTSLLVPTSLSPTLAGNGQDVSSTLETTLSLSSLAPSYEFGHSNATQAEFLLRSTNTPDTAADWEVGGPVLETLQKRHIILTYVGGSADLCHLILYAAEETEPLLAVPAGSSLYHIYELNRGCNGEPTSLRFVALDNSNKMIDAACGDTLGVSPGGSSETSFSDSVPSSAFNAVSTAGGEVFFTATVVNSCTENNAAVAQLFVRLGGTRTLEISRPLNSTCTEVPCGGEVVAGARASAYFVGASQDGSRVFFTTKAPLVEGDKDEGNDLYMASIGCPSGVGEACEPAETHNMSVTSLVQVSHDPNAGEAAEVQGVVSIAPNGARVYFVARGVLDQASNKQGDSPVKGADNLYVYDSDTKSLAFIADLCSGPASSGVAEDLRCPSTVSEGLAGNDTFLWGHPGEYSYGAQTAGIGGQFLVFETYAQLLPDDTDTAMDVYRYDAETGGLERVSVGEAGYDANGNNDAFNAHLLDVELNEGLVQEVYRMNSRAVSEDGSRIVFTTSGPLSPEATNGLENAYEWYQAPGESEGKLSLISSGSGSQSVDDVVISPEGKNIFFVTSQGLVPQDTDGAPDVYDARLGAGFPAQAAPPQECSGDGCQGPLTNPAPLLVPGSLSQTPGENFAPTVAVPAKADTQPKRVRCKRGYVKRKNKCVKASTKAKKARVEKSNGRHTSTDRKGNR